MSVEANKLTMDKKFPTKLTKLVGSFADRPTVLYADTVYFADDDEDNVVTYWINKKGVWSKGGEVGHVLKSFVATNNYVEDELIKEDGKLYVAKVDFESDVTFNESDWNEVSASAKHIIRGVHSDTEIYRAKDVVMHNDK